MRARTYKRMGKREIGRKKGSECGREGKRRREGGREEKEIVREVRRRRRREKEREGGEGLEGGRKGERGEGGIKEAERVRVDI